MLHAYVERFDVMVEGEIFWVCMGSEHTHRVNMGAGGVDLDVRILDD
jgi:hypothetical protein